MQYSLVQHEDGSANLTVFADGKTHLASTASHSNFDQIVTGVLADDKSVIDLFNVAKTASKKFERLTERITTQSGRLYLDGVEVDNSLATQVVRFLSEGVEDWKPLVRFFENVQANSEEHSREQLYTWLEKRDFTITEDGLIVGYKGVRATDDGFVSINTGRAIVDGVVMNGAIPNKKGSLIEMPRNEVAFDPSTGCSTGLHVGTHRYAENFALGGLLEVHVNPRDVVSVPTDSDWEKMRVCRYLVVDTIDAPHTKAVIGDYYDEDEDSDYWGDRDEDESLENAFTNVFPFPEEPVADLTTDEVEVGDVFETTDARRQGTQFKVESVERDPLNASRYVAVGKSLPRNITRSINIDRLLSRAYRKV